MAGLYYNRLNSFIEADPNHLLGLLVSGLADQGFDTTKLTAASWQQEISELHESLRPLPQLISSNCDIYILLEYVLPIIGQRLDCVLLINNMIFVIEYKGGCSSNSRAALHQAKEYALNLRDFHEESRNQIIVPIAVGAFKTAIAFDENAVPMQGTSVSPNDLASIIARAHRRWANLNTRIDPDAWNRSRYFPVPSIIEAASAVYLDHDVKDLAYSRSGIDNLEATQNAIAECVRDARTRNVKKLIVVTGVPGSGKTLAGLNAVQLLQKELNLKDEQASFLSGNGPLVEVLREALKRSVGRRKKGVARSVQSRIREMHRFVRDSYDDARPPVDKLIVFDEAQRAWTAEKNRKKFGRDIAEPEMVLEIMGRHTNWAVVVALVGGGQEIHGGEAGLAAWGDAIARHNDWEVATSPEALHGGHSVAGSRLFRSPCSHMARIEENPQLHLAISKRSFETEITAAWVNAVLDGRQEDASSLADSDQLPIYLTRDLNAARSWLRKESHGHRRTGLVASSGAARLRAEGVEPPTFSFLGGIDYPKWFLEPDGDHRSSNQLEVALSEFELQGLELDLVGLLWGGDLLFIDGQVVTRRLAGQKWNAVSGTGDPQSSADNPRTRILNKYRVLMTRFRKGMVIFVPTGSLEDPTRSPDGFNATYTYLLDCGAKPLDSANT